jgi:hypothetical protein
MKQSVTCLVGALLIALAIAGGVLVAFLYKPLVGEYVEARVFDACASAYRLEYNDVENDTVVVSPNMEEVKKCIEELGGR